MNVEQNNMSNRRRIFCR